MKSNDQPIIAVFRRPHKLADWMHRTPWLYCIAVGVIIVAVVITGVILATRKTNETATNVCTLRANHKLLQSTAQDLQNYNITGLASQVFKIQSLPNYTKDPNCLYPLMYYYINTSDSKNSSLYLNDLKAVYNPKVGYNHVLDLTYSLKTLEVDVTNLKKVNQEIQNNAVYLPTTYKPTTNQQ